MLIGLTGNAGAGKSTAAALLRQYHRMERFAFAERLKHICYTMCQPLGTPRTSFYGTQIDKELPRPELGDRSGREVLVEMGQYGRALNPLIWVQPLAHAIADAGSNGVVVEDVRYPNEAEYIRALGGVIIRIVRPCAHPYNEDEIAMCHEDADFVIVNDTHNRADLYAALADILESLEDLRHV